jgi:hypothetical protein
MTASDVVMTCAMNSRIGGNEVCELFKPSQTPFTGISRVNELLRAMPLTQDLCAAFSDDDKAHLRDIVTVLCGITGVGIARAMKILALKRPSFVPMLDRLVVQYYESWRPDASWQGIADKQAVTAEEIGVGAVDLIEQGFRPDLCAAHDKLAELGGLVEAKVREDWDLNIAVPPVRVLDSLLWFEEGGKDNF